MPAWAAPRMWACKSSRCWPASSCTMCPTRAAPKRCKAGSPAMSTRWPIRAPGRRMSRPARCACWRPGARSARSASRTRPRSRSRATTWSSTPPTASPPPAPRPHRCRRAGRPAPCRDGPVARCIPAGRGQRRVQGRHRPARRAADVPGRPRLRKIHPRGLSARKRANRKTQVARVAVKHPAGKVTMSTTPLLRLHPRDNVLVTTTALALGQPIAELGLRARAQVPAGHKIAACHIAAGAPVKKCDTVIGVALRDLAPGEHVHSHTLKMADCHRDPAFGADLRPVQYLPEDARARFQGFVRADGRVGTRNFIGILASVNCSATVIRHIAAHFTPERLAAFPRVDGVAAFAQTSGCGMSSPGAHFDLLRRTLAGYARHPNLAGVLIVGLGCERNQVDALIQAQGLRPGQALRTLVMQEIGGTRATIEAGIRAVEEMLPE